MQSDKLTITIYSFGYHLSGIPADERGHGGGFVFDCRGLPNPGREERFKEKTGRDLPVIRYLRKSEVVHQFLEHAFHLVELTARNYRQRGFEALMVAFGCTGGQHRSVFCAESLGKRLRKAGYQIKIIHKDLPQIP